MKQSDPEKNEAIPAPEQLDLLNDHATPVWHLFDQYEQLKGDGDDRKKRELAAHIWREIEATTRSLEERNEA
jgi:hypothetical protein